MPRVPSITSDSLKEVRDAIKRGGPMPFVPPTPMRGEKEKPIVEGNPNVEKHQRQPGKVNPELLKRVVAGARKRRR